MAAPKTFSAIQPVPPATAFIDIALSRTQRKTPTIIHKNFKISRIRSFYARKVKFTQDTFSAKLSAILDQFPKLNDCHPFHADLINILYDRDHLKIALSQISTARHLIEQVSRDYVRLMKFGDSLYRCKQLKRAALGRMATIIRRQKDPLAYLEQVRQHLSRLPSIDPNTRTLILCGYPNVGKSSFINKITRAEVDVQPYAFTTKSLFVGHMDYKYLRWQVVDTPGILDHPLEEMNTIEMQSITALAHLRACILYFMDLSEQCGYSIEAQINLFQSIKPLFANKVTVLVINKCDVMRIEHLDPQSKELLDSILSMGDVEVMQTSCFTDEGVMDVRTKACDKLLASRVEAKLKGSKINRVLNKIHLARPVARDNEPRLPCIPDAVLQKRTAKGQDNSLRKPLAREIEEANGGAGVYNVDLKQQYLLEYPEWKHDPIPELLDGKNVADFIDPDIEARLIALEEEEEALESKGFYDSDQDMSDEEQTALHAKANMIRNKNAMIQRAAQNKKSALKNRAIIPRKAVHKKMSDLKSHLSKIGLSSRSIEERTRSRSRYAAPPSGAEVVMRDASRMSSRSRVREPSSNRREAGIKDLTAKGIAEKISRMQQKKANRMARAGEADRHVPNVRPKHLFSGKRNNGKTDRR
ncbi:putative nucleolar GTP-binding protein 1 [Neolecta irregularis DAH-3]|uniref:Nucleolar GTP-binding protein 1 n=1 Tax=Neolecta irregularis (strain DAH-3) TaxID=1198029 RepID=A0A1U7LV62_NEOID|nr:putative nucleolar GTP-binding protein 1 [Neolecta irregularis DAH-3]|eukprot:OLL26560.1 putative nucleolar GTP-binding protein 1 [Neolecta irregularis DAH-3]